MAVKDPRSRLVYFRLSQSEFEQLSALCNGEEGARSVSQLSRSAVRNVLAGEQSDHNLSEEVGRVSQKLSRLEDAVRQLLQIMNPESAVQFAKQTLTFSSEDACVASGGEVQSQKEKNRNE